MNTSRSQPFRYLLRDHRRAGGLTQEQLAECSGLTSRAVGNLERGATLRPRRETIQRLSAALNLPAKQHREFEAAARRKAPDILSSVRAAAAVSVAPVVVASDTWTVDNLPAATNSFVGRERELQQVRGLLWRATTRLVTLTGAGGSGKTRLALEVAANMRDEFAGGVYLVDLAPLTDPALVLVQIAKTLSMRNKPGQVLLDSLKSYLREKQILLLLDNFEHLISAAPLVAELLVATRRLKVLVTSRERLRLRGEHEFMVLPLEVPQAGNITVARLNQYEAARLFVERAEVQTDFAVTDENAPLVAEICVRLDGLPLALELAAAWLKLLNPQGLLARLDSRLQLLTGGAVDLPARQQTIRQTIEWSYELLSRVERCLFERMAIFAGGCTLEAAAAVCGGGLDVDVLKSLGSLLDKSLVYRREGVAGEPRYLMLETIHEYAREKLHSSEEEAELERRHALYIMRLAEQADPELTRGQQAEWLDRLEAEHENTRAALRWARERSGSVAERAEAVEVGLRIAGSIWRFWLVRDYLGEASRQLGTLLELDAAVGTEVAAIRAPAPARQYRAKALYGAGVVASRHGRFTAARSLGEDSLALQRELGDKRGIAASLNLLGRLTGSQWDYSAGRSLLEESLALRRELGDTVGITGSLSNLGDLTWWNGDYVAARSLFEESLALCRELGDKEGIAFTLGRLGTMAWQQGNYATARSRIEESLALTRELEHKSLIALLLCELGLVDFAQGDFTTARSRIEESLALAREFGDKADVASILGYVGQMDYVQGDYAAAHLSFEESLLLARDFGGSEGIASALNNLGLSTYRQGDYATARSLLEQSLARYRQDGDKLGIATALIYMNGLAVASATSMEVERERVSGEHNTKEGAVERGARLLGAAEAILASMGAVLDPLNQKVCERDIAAAREQLGEESFALTRKKGQSMTLEQAVAYALDQNEQTALATAQSIAPPGETPQTKGAISTSPKLAGNQQDDLTAREAEVLRLLAASLSDGQIAERLVLSKRTVQAHIRAIYSKLNVSNRSAATRHAIEHGL